MLFDVFVSFVALTLAVPEIVVPADAVALNTGLKVEEAPPAIELVAVQLIVPLVALTAGVVQFQPAGVAIDWKLDPAGTSIDQVPPVAALLPMF